MARGTIKIRYKVQVTRRVSVQTRVRYSVSVIATVRDLVAHARARGDAPSDDDHEQLFSNACALLPPRTEQGEIRDAIDAVRGEDDAEK